MTSFKQLDQYLVAAEIVLMEWNPMLDLIALATVSGELLLHRLSWQKVWSIASRGTKEKAVLITALAWRPDGKILAYAYDNGKIILCDVENSEDVHELDVRCIVTSLAWVQWSEKTDTEYKSFYRDRSEEFLPKLNAFKKGYGTTSTESEETADDFKRMKGQKDLNILAIGMEVGMLHLHSFGIFPTGFIDVNIEPEDPLHDRVISVTMSGDFKMLTVILETVDEEGNYSYYYRSYYISLLNDYVEEIKVVSLKYGQISSLLTYLSSTIRAISEAWEDILLEVDTKLHNYARQKYLFEKGSISDDFLELLMFGNPSDSLEKFLLHDLTQSGLKKFGHSMELSYSEIQKLVLKCLQNVSYSLFYHLNDFRGMASWKERFGPLGLEETAIRKAVLMVGSLLLKAVEMQQVIANSMRNFKKFFGWLYSVILRLSDEPIPMELSELTLQDMQFVAEFLKENFSAEYDENKRTTVYLERVAQYLKKEDLPYPVSTEGNPWIKFLKDNPSIYNTGLIFPYYPKKSLVTLYAELRKVIDTAVKGPWVVLQKTATLHSFYLLKDKSKTKSPPLISHVSYPETGEMFTVITDSSPPCSHFYLVRNNLSKALPLDAIGVTFRDLQCQPTTPSPATDKSKKQHQILDLKFYSKDTITVLLLEDSETENNFPILLQLSVSALLPELKEVGGVPGQLLGQNVPILDAAPFIEKNNYKRLENMKASQIAVSGSRKVVCVLFASKRQVRLFEMDVDEEEEGEETEHEDSMVKDASRDTLFSDEEIDAVKQSKEQRP